MILAIYFKLFFCKKQKNLFCQYYVDWVFSLIKCWYIHNCAWWYLILSFKSLSPVKQTSHALSSIFGLSFWFIVFAPVSLWKVYFLFLPVHPVLSPVIVLIVPMFPSCYLCLSLFSLSVHLFLPEGLHFFSSCFCFPLCLTFSIICGLQFWRILPRLWLPRLSSCPLSFLFFIFSCRYFAL